MSKASRTFKIDGEYSYWSWYNMPRRRRTLKSYRMAKRRIGASWRRERRSFNDMMSTIMPNEWAEFKRSMTDQGSK